MSTNPPEWSRLVAAARRAPKDERDESAPYGFSTRVAARAMTTKTPLLEASMLSRYGLRALGVSCLLAVACVAATYRPIMTAIEDEAASLSETSAEMETTELS
jgi:hypothetical protein